MDEKKASKTNDAIKAALARFQVPIAIVLALVALAFGWDAWQQGAAGRAAGSVASEGARLQQEEKKLIADVVKRFDQALTTPAVQAAVGAGDFDAAGTAFGAALPGSSAVVFLAPDLNSAYAAPATFGYGRLATLDATLRDGVTRISAARVDGKPMLVLASVIKSKGEVQALATAALPTDTLAKAITEADPGGGFLSLRFNQFDLASVGEKETTLLGTVDSLKLLDNGFFVVTASPQGALSWFGFGPIFEYILMALLLIAAFALFRFGGRLQPGAVDEEDDEATMAQQLSAEPERKIVVTEPAKRAPVAIERSIFRAYDIRGVVGETIDKGVAKLIGQAIGTAMQAQGLKEIVVGRDGRLSGPELSQALIEGLQLAGRDVIDIGLAPTPLTYFASYQLRTGCCVSITGSHNPADYNGFKIVLAGDALYGDAIQALYATIAEGGLFAAPAPGTLQTRDVSEDYIHRIAEDVQLERKLKVVVDCGNGVAGMLAPEVLEAIGAEVAPIFCEVDGTFPNHHPDPGDPKNLTDVIQMVERLDADLGLAFDGDGDRLGVVTRKGEIIYPDRVLMLLAGDVLERNPGAVILYDVKCTGHLASHILRHGGSPLMWKTGHSLIKAKMKETGAELAGEMSGHFFFKERWYGFDDAIYAAARLLEILATRAETPDEIFASLPTSFSTPELQVPMADETATHAFIDAFRTKSAFDGARIATIDGIRADWPDGWGLVRASNTTPVLVLRFDADTPEALLRIQEAFRVQLLAVNKGLALPF